MKDTEQNLLFNYHYIYHNSIIMLSQEHVVQYFNYKLNEGFCAILDILSAYTF